MAEIIGQCQKSRIIRIYTVAVIWALLLTPSWPTPAGLPSVRLDDILLVFAPVLIAVTCSRVYLDTRVALMLLIAMSVEAGILAGVMLGYPGSLLDHFVWVRIAKYIGAIMLASALVVAEGSGHQALKWVTKRTWLPGIILVGIVVQQYFNLFGLNESYVRFVAPTQYETLVEGYPWPRPVGLVGNPNELSFLLGILSLTAIWIVLNQRRSRLAWGLLALAFLVAASSTLSRSGVFAIFGAMAIFAGSRMAMNFRVKRSDVVLRTRSIILGAGFFIAIAVIISAFWVNDALYNEIGWRFSPENYGSFTKRVERWEENIGLWMNSPIVGVGTLKHSGFLEYAADNEWLFLARTGGVLLVGLVVMLLVSGLFRSDIPKNDRCFAWAIVSGASLYMIPAAFFYSLVIMPVALIFLTAASPRPWRVVKIRGRVGDRAWTPGTVSVVDHPG